MTTSKSKKPTATFDAAFMKLFGFLGGNAPHHKALAERLSDSTYAAHHTYADLPHEQRCRIALRLFVAHLFSYIDLINFQYERDRYDALLTPEREQQMDDLVQLFNACRTIIHGVDKTLMK